MYYITSAREIFFIHQHVTWVTQKNNVITSPTNETQWLESHVTSGKQSTRHLHDVLTLCNSGPVELTLCFTGWCERNKTMLLLPPPPLESPSSILPLSSSDGLVYFSCSDWLRHPLISTLGAAQNRRANKLPEVRRRAGVHLFQSFSQQYYQSRPATVSLIGSHGAQTSDITIHLGGSLVLRRGSCRWDVSSCPRSLTSTDTRPRFVIKRLTALLPFVNMGLKLLFYNV